MLAGKKEVCKTLSSDSYPVFLQDLPEGNGLRANEAPKILYIVAALENITFESEKSALLFAWNSLGVVVVASCNEPLDLAGKVFCETKSVRPVAQLTRQEMQWEPLVCMCSQWCRGEGKRIRSRRVISSAFAETKSPALSCWAHSSL